jgi:hypothetical protein
MGTILASYREHGFAALLSKPYRIDELRDCLNAFIS